MNCLNHSMNTILKDRVRESKEAISEIDYSISILKNKIDVQKQFIVDLKKQSEDNVVLWNDEIIKIQKEIEFNKKVLRRLQKKNRAPKK